METREYLTLDKNDLQTFRTEEEFIEDFKMIGRSNLGVYFKHGVYEELAKKDFVMYFTKNNRFITLKSRYVRERFDEN